MSNTDSFIDEVTEEVRRDRLFAMMRRYGWIAVLAVVLIVAGAGWNEWRKAQARNTAQALGDAMLAALERPDAAARAEALASIAAPTPAGKAVLDMLTAAERAAEDPAGAARRLLAVADDPEVPAIYRQIATLKAAALPGSGLDAAARRSRLDGIAMGSGLTAMLAEEQLAYLDIETGDSAAALERLQQIAADATATPGLRQRAAQVIVALGGDPAGLAPGTDDMHGMQ